MLQAVSILKFWNRMLKDSNCNSIFKFCQYKSLKGNVNVRRRWCTHVANVKSMQGYSWKRTHCVWTPQQQEFLIRRKMKGVLARFWIIAWTAFSKLDIFNTLIPHYSSAVSGFVRNIQHSSTALGICKDFLEQLYRRVLCHFHTCFHSYYQKMSLFLWSYLAVIYSHPHVISVSHSILPVTISRFLVCKF